MLFVIKLIHCHIWPNRDETLNHFYRYIQSWLDLVDFRLFPLADDIVDLFAFGEVIADADAQTAELAASKCLDDVFQSIMTAVAAFFLHAERSGHS